MNIQTVWSTVRITKKYSSSIFQGTNEKYCNISLSNWNEFCDNESTISTARPYLILRAILANKIAVLCLKLI